MKNVTVPVKWSPPPDALVKAFCKGLCITLIEDAIKAYEIEKARLGD